MEQYHGLVIEKKNIKNCRERNNKIFSISLLLYNARFLQTKSFDNSAIRNEDFSSACGAHHIISRFKSILNIE